MLAELSNEIEDYLKRYIPDIDPKKYARNFGIGGDCRYNKINTKTLEMANSALSVSTNAGVLLNKYLLISLLKGFYVDNRVCKIPASIVELYQRDIKRIEMQLQQLDAEFYHLDNDAFLKDLAILSHRLIPVGAEYVFPYSGVPRSIIFKGGFLQLGKGLKAYIESGGFYPFLELHAHVLNLKDFNPDGWRATYLRIAELLELNSDFKGVTSSSWFLDPELKNISPHLAYLREFPEEHGATILFSSYDKHGESGALEKSDKRRRLYESDEYKPAIYTRIWPRKKIIDWKNTEISS